MSNQSGVSNQARLFYVPIEPFPGRYTQSWYDNFPVAFRKFFPEVFIVDGTPLTTEIRVGTFLDMSSTVHYKATQLQEIAKLFSNGQVQDGDVFFFGDIEYWGIESVRLMADMHGLKRVKLTGFLHAASYTIDDAFAIAAPYQQFTELGWVACMDKVFVGSHYHKRAFVERRLYPWNRTGVAALADKIKVTGNPLFASDYLDSTPASWSAPARTRTVLLPNRFDKEKGAMESLDVAQIVHNNDPSIRFVITTSHAKLRSNDPTALHRAFSMRDAGILDIEEGLTKSMYHSRLRSSYMMLSMSKEENFGYCIAEALLYGCKPLMQEGLSHVEFLDPQIHVECFFPPELLDGSPTSAQAIAHMVLANMNQRYCDRGFYPDVPTLTRCSNAASAIAQACLS